MDDFTTYFWNEIIKDKNNLHRVFINNKAYYINKEDKYVNPDWRGFGGQLFYIKKNNGEIIRTSNLWYNGEIPDKFRNALPNTAKFLSYEEVLEIEKNSSKFNVKEFSK